MEEEKTKKKANNAERLNIYQKLFYIQQKLRAPKDQYNESGDFRYRSAESILGAVKPLLKDLGLMITFQDEVVQLGDRWYVRTTCQLLEPSMEREGGMNAKIETSAWAREEDDKEGMDGSQITGASSSYAHKYALSSLFALNDVADSDATNRRMRSSNSRTGNRPA